MKCCVVTLYGKEFFVFSNLPVSGRTIEDMLMYAVRGRIGYRFRSWRFFWTRKPVCWQVEEMLLFTVNENRHYGGLAIGLAEADTWRWYRHKIKEAYGDDGAFADEKPRTVRESTESYPQRTVVGDKAYSHLLS